MEKFFENMARKGGISLFKAQKAKRMDVFKREKKKWQCYGYNLTA